MTFDDISYVIGMEHGYSEGIEDGKRVVEIENGVTCTDDGNGNVTITEDN